MSMLGLFLFRAGGLPNDLIHGIDTQRDIIL